MINETRDNPKSKKPSENKRPAIPGKSLFTHDNPRAKWRHKRPPRRVDAQGMEPVRKRVLALLKKRREP
jgi:hypothetical protein